jgi:hypothetical protein
MNNSSKLLQRQLPDLSVHLGPEAKASVYHYRTILINAIFFRKKQQGINALYRPEPPCGQRKSESISYFFATSKNAKQVHVRRVRYTSSWAPFCHPSLHGSSRTHSTQKSSQPRTDLSASLAPPFFFFAVTYSCYGCLLKAMPSLKTGRIHNSS